MSDLPRGIGTPVLERIQRISLGTGDSLTWRDSSTTAPRVGARATGLDRAVRERRAPGDPGRPWLTRRGAEGPAAIAGALGASHESGRVRA